YTSAPGKKMDKPSEELRAFAKTSLLQPGRSETLIFTLSPADLASFDTDRTAWVAEEGNYKVNIGASSTDIRQSTTFNLPKEIIVTKVHKSFVPETSINEMKKSF